MNITVIGAGYVGLVSAACLAEMGNNVRCVERDSAKLELLKEGKSPIYEPGLETLLKDNLQTKRLQFTADISEALRETLVCFIAVGTPQSDDGAVDLRFVREVAGQIGQTMQSPLVIVTKSTVPVGTTAEVGRIVQDMQATRGVQIDFQVASNPEFLKEGDAVHDFMRPDRVIIGTDHPHAIEVLKEVYAPFMRNFDKLMIMSARDAEMTKYAANAMLATRISFMNEVASICENLGVDVENVRKGIGSDSRIGYAFIYPGCGYGGSCFPKDVAALEWMARHSGFEPLVLSAVRERNYRQQRALFQKISARFGGRLNGKCFAIWGLSFKPGTDDMRDAPSLVLIDQLISAGATVAAYDPAAGQSFEREAKPHWKTKFTLHESQYAPLTNADALVLVTEWKPFRHPDLALVKAGLKQPIIFDGRNQYDPAQMQKEGIEYYAIGRGISQRADAERAR